MSFHRSFASTFWAKHTRITLESLPDAIVGSAYSATIAVSGSTPFLFSVTSGSLPTGLSLNANSGEITGTPTTSGNYNVTIRARNSGGRDSQAYIFAVLPAQVALSSPSNEAFITDVTPDLTWTAGDSGVDRYRVVITTDDDVTFSSPVIDTTNVGTTYTSTTLNNMTIFRWKVAAVNDDSGEGLFSAVRRFSTQVYELQIEFTAVDDAPMTTPYVGEVGNLTIRDSANLMSTSGGKLTFATSTTSVVAWEKQITRTAGRVLRNHTNQNVGSNISGIRDDSNISSNINVMQAGFRFDSTQVGDGGTAATTTVFSSFSTYKHWWIVLRSTGSYMFASTDSDPANITLIWVSDLGNAASPYWRLVRAGSTAATLESEYTRAYLLNNFTDLGYAAVNVSSPATGTRYQVGDDDFILTLLFTYPVSPSTNDKIELRFNIQDASNYWTAYLIYTGSQWDFHVDSVVSGSATARITTATNVGTQTYIRVQKQASRRIYYTRNGSTAWTQRGAITTTVYLDSVDSVAAVFNAGTMTSLTGYPNHQTSYQQLVEDGAFLVPEPSAQPPDDLITPPDGQVGDTTWTQALDEYINNSAKFTDPMDTAASEDSYQIGRTLPISLIPIMMAHETRPAKGYYDYVKTVMAVIKPTFIDHSTSRDPGGDGFRDILWKNDPSVTSLYNTDYNNLDETMMTSFFALWALWAKREGDAAESTYWQTAVEETLDKWISRGQPAEHPLDDNLAHSRIRSALLYWCLFGLTSDEAWSDAAAYEYNFFTNYMYTQAVGAETATLWNHQYTVPTDDPQKNTYARYTAEVLYLLNYLGFTPVTNTIVNQVGIMLRGIDYADFPTTVADKIDGTGTPAFSNTKSAQANFWYYADREAALAIIAEDINDLVETGTQQNPSIPGCLVAAGL
jgi:hypothetical protein